MSLQNFFYDEQIKRYLLQFIRFFSNFQVETGIQRDGNRDLLRVPVKYGDYTRQVGHILRENSENSVIPTPQISCYITNLEFMRNRIQEPFHVEKKNFREREYDPLTQTYQTTHGNMFTLERIMPSPYDLILNVDIWTSNTNQKLQLLEQILALFNPSFEIQATDNYVDWTSLTRVEIESTNWSSRSVPVGADDSIDVATLSFRMPIWLNMPAKVKKLGVVHNIIASIYDGQGDLPTDILDDSLLMEPRQFITPMNAGILVLNNQVTLLRANETVQPQNDEFGVPVAITEDTPLDWPSFINQYGALRNGLTQIRLNQDPTDVSEERVEVIGFVALHPTNNEILLFTPDGDTLPINTLTSVTGIIDPQQTGPGTVGFPDPVDGVRYLLLKDIGSAQTTAGEGPVAWGSFPTSGGGDDVVALANDIIEYDSGTEEWSVSWTPDGSTLPYVTNLNTSIQYQWNGTQWVKSWWGEYRSGSWAIVI